MTCCGGSGSSDDVFDVGDQAVIEFAIVPTALHPDAESTAITVKVQRPDGSLFGEYDSPHVTLSRATSSESVDGVPTTVTTWTFEMPSPFDVGSQRRPWTVRAESTAGIVAAVETSRWVRRPAIS